MTEKELNNMNEQVLNSVLKLYPNPEKMPDKPYFTKEIFLNLCLNDMTKLLSVLMTMDNQECCKVRRKPHQLGW